MIGRKLAQRAVAMGEPGSALCGTDKAAGSGARDWLSKSDHYR